MAKNKLVILRSGTSMGLIVKAYLNIDEDEAQERFYKKYGRYSSSDPETVDFDTELTIGSEINMMGFISESD